MIHGYSPFKPDKPKFKICDVISNIKIQDLKFNKDISQESKELIIHLLDRDITRRYKIEDIFNSKFVKFYENKNNNITQKNIDINYINPNIDIHKEFFNKVENNNNNQKNEIKRNQIVINDKEKQKIKNNVKNNTARNFYPNPLGNNKEKEKIENTKNNKYGSNCKIKKTINKFEKNDLITPRYISQQNLNNIFKKSNVKEKKKKNNAFSKVDLLAEFKNNEMKSQSAARNLNQKENNIKNGPNQSLTYRNNQFGNFTVKNKQISIEQKNKNNNLIKEIIKEANKINYFEGKMNYTNREKIKNKKINSCENFIQKKYNEENKSGPLIIDIYDNNINNVNNVNRKHNVKVKILQTEGNKNEEVKMINNFINNNYPGKRNTKVKNNRINNKIENKTFDNNNNYNNNTSSAPQINKINNNRIYNKNIIKYSTFISNNIKKKKNKKEENKNIIRNFDNYKSSQDNAIVLFHNNNNKIQNIFPIKTQLNEDKHYFEEENTIQDLDETPKKDIDNLKIMPHELLNKFSKELKGYLKKE